MASAIRAMSAYPQAADIVRQRVGKKLSRRLLCIAMADMKSDGGFHPHESVGQRESDMAKLPKSELVAVSPKFDYSLLEPKAAGELREKAQSIRARVRKTLEEIIEIGKELLSVKDTLPHGSFGLWLKCEFGWAERMAQNFMAVAQAFGPKPEIIADLAIQPTAAYLLAAPSAPEEARQAAIERAESGEKITTAIAKSILAESRKKKSKKRKRVSTETLAPRLLKVLKRYRDQWNPTELSELARQLREFVDALEKDEPRERKRKKQGI